MDPISTELTKKGISSAVEAAKEFLLKIAGPAADEIGLLFEDQVRFYRLKNQLRILAKAEEMLKRSGHSPRTVPFRTLLPILEAAASEDDESLATKWAALLANAAADIDNSASLHSYPRILSEITPIEARFLDELSARGGEADWNSFRSDLSSKFQVSQDDIDRYFENLFRLGLVLITIKKGIPNSVVKVGPYGKVFISACNSS